MELPKRKPNRLQEFDYSSNGAYFLTLCVKLHREILWRDGDGKSLHSQPLSAVGKIVDGEINRISGIYGDSVVVDLYVIMPNHIHMIVTIDAESCGQTQDVPTISRVIQQFKGAVSKKLGYSIWQKSFHDHIIRNDLEYQRIWEYIETNPMKWEEDRYYSVQKS